MIFSIIIKCLFLLFYKVLLNPLKESSGTLKRFGDLKGIEFQENLRVSLWGRLNKSTNTYGKLTCGALLLLEGLGMGKAGGRLRVTKNS